MKFTLSWLKDYLDTTASTAEIATALTALGLEVEAIDDPAARLGDFIVAEITHAAPHPDADKLQICTVDDGTVTRQIVCGAANARKGLKTVLAREGVYIPGGDFTIKPTKIRGVESNGMLCSPEELGIVGDSRGIIELNHDATLGKPAAAALGVDDPVFDISITPNRADCFGIYGIARDLAAVGIGTLKPLPSAEFFAAFTSPLRVETHSDACPLLIGCHIKDLKNGDSPAWLKNYLQAIGISPISSLVDITNYFTHAFGRPLHVFDAQKISGGISARPARDGEIIEALNGKSYTLDPSMLVIADAQSARGIAGVMGEEASGVSDGTTEVLLEVALFDPIAIAHAGRKLDILSDARTRFERGVDSGFAHSAAQRAVALILELCGGEASALMISGDVPAAPAAISFAPAHVNKLSGVTLSDDEIKNIFNDLGFAVKVDSQEWQVTPPTWRRDSEGAADLVEEVLRVHGYDAIALTPLPKPAGLTAMPLTPMQQRVATAKRTLAARGLLEAKTWSFLTPEAAAFFGGGDERLRLQNPISVELSVMRPSLLANLADAAVLNNNRGNADIALFEVGHVFTGTAPDQQHRHAASLRTGNVETVDYAQGYQPEARSVDCFDAKADALSLLQTLNVNADSLMVQADAPAWYHPNRSGSLKLGKTLLGYFGELHPALCTKLGLEGRVAVAEITLDAIPTPRAKGTAKPAYKVSAYPAVTRDFAFIVSRDMTASALLKAIRGADKSLINHVELFDAYRGKGMADDAQSLAVSVTLQAMDRTLTEDEISRVSQAVITQAAKYCGAQLRQ